MQGAPVSATQEAHPDEGRIKAELKNACEGEFKSYVLYIQSNHAPSAEALEALRSNPYLSADTWVQNVKHLRGGVRPPAWLTNTPVFVDKDKKLVYRGKKALERLADTLAVATITTTSSRRGGSAFAAQIDSRNTFDMPEDEDWSSTDKKL